MEEIKELEKILRERRPEVVDDLIDQLQFDYSDKAAFYRIYDTLPENYIVFIPAFMEIMSSLIRLVKTKNYFALDNAKTKDEYKS